jgi:uncharacterized protein with FMN-binding domain
MKKFALSFFVVFIFTIYVLQQKFGDEEGGNVVAPASLGGNQGGNNGSQAGISGSPPAGVTYKDGVYTGDVTDAYYGNVQVQTTVAGGKIADVKFLDYPSDRQTSQEINSQAMPYLKQEAIAVQSANVDIVSGATQTSLAFRKSLQSALAKAQ